jgi:hypothetical protein
MSVICHSRAGGNLVLYLLDLRLREDDTTELTIDIL